MWGFDTSRFLRSTEVHTLLDPSSYCCGFLRALAVQAAEPRAPVVKLWRLPRSWPSFGSIVRTGAPLTSITRVLQTSYMDKDSTMMCMQLWMHGCMDAWICSYVCTCVCAQVCMHFTFPRLTTNISFTFPTHASFSRLRRISLQRFLFASTIPTDLSPTFLACFRLTFPKQIRMILRYGMVCK